MSSYDFQNAIQEWRDLNAANGHDPVGDELAARAERRFRHETYNDAADYAPEPDCTCYCVGDRADASDCELHNPRPRDWGESNYNHGQMAFDFDKVPPAAAVTLIESVDDFLLDEGVAS